MAPGSPGGTGHSPQPEAARRPPSQRRPRRGSAPERVVVGGDGLLEAALLGEERGLLGPRATLHRHLAGLVGEAHRVAERVVGLGESPVQALNLGGEEPGAGLANRVAAASSRSIALSTAVRASAVRPSRMPSRARFR